jgi:hypothetical protein
MNYDATGCPQFEAIKIALKQDSNGYILTLRIHPDELEESVLRDFVGARYAVALVRIQDDESPTPYDTLVKRAGILCRTREFQLWLIETGAATEKTEAAAVEALYELCGIKSRTELNGNEAAKEQFHNMVTEYEQWKNSDPF